jgi:hypothetical protein
MKIEKVQKIRRKGRYEASAVWLTIWLLLVLLVSSRLLGHEACLLLLHETRGLGLHEARLLRLHLHRVAYKTRGRGSGSINH